MKKTLLSILSLVSLTAFSQWQSTPITFQGQDCYAAFGKLFTDAVTTNTLNVSTDEGISFANSNTGLSSGVNFGVLNAGTLYAFNANNIYQSTTGNNWTLMASATATNDQVKAMTVVNGTVLAVTNPISGVSSKIFQLSGSNWTLRTSVASTLITTIENLNNTLYAGTTATCVLKSTDGGLTFTHASNGITPLTNFYDKYIIAFGATSSAIYCSTLGGRVFKSVDGGANWTQTYMIGNGSSTLGVYDFYTLPNNNLLTVSDSGFVYTTNNGATWIKDNVGLTPNSGSYQVNKIAVTTNYIITSDKDGKIMRKLLTQLPVGIKENAANVISSSVYPNPAKDAATIESAALQSETNCEVKVRNLIGKEIGTYKMMDGKANINLQAYAKGVYTYQVYQNNSALSTGKLIVN